MKAILTTALMGLITVTAVNAQSVNVQGSLATDTSVKNAAAPDINKNSIPKIGGVKISGAPDATAAKTPSVYVHGSLTTDTMVSNSAALILQKHGPAQLGGINIGGTSKVHGSINATTNVKNAAVIKINKADRPLTDHLLELKQKINELRTLIESSAKAFDVLEATACNPVELSAHAEQQLQQALQSPEPAAPAKR